GRFSPADLALTHQATDLSPLRGSKLKNFVYRVLNTKIETAVKFLISGFPDCTQHSALSTQHFLPLLAFRRFN
ncbi:MAG: hypothetical protein KF868_18360, partial [Acidobacteria bacterium]|nr:hypothetical protein [Acidobacteriota bacterium]